MAGVRGYRALAKTRRLHIVCDEAHHLGERGRWADAVSSIPAASKLLLSATPVRLDREAISDARYIDDAGGYKVIDPLVQVSMRQAWKERRILKHLNIQMKDYAVQLRSAEGEVSEFTASEMAELPDFDQRCVRQQLRWNEDYVQPLVREFALTLQAKIAAAPGKHQGLVFAATTEHANHLARVFERWHPALRCLVVHSVDITGAENDRGMKEFHAGRHDVLIQVRKASEGFDQPRVSVLLKLDAIFSREPVIQQLGRGLRYHHELTEPQNLLHVFVGRDPRLSGIIEHLEREAPPAPLVLSPEGIGIEVDETLIEELPEDAVDDDTRPEIVDVVEAGDVHLDHEGRYIDGQQMTFFGVEPPAVAKAASATLAPVTEVVDLHAELREAIEYCKTWTNRAARARAERRGPGENHHAALNLQYARESGRRGSLNTPAEYRTRGDWMKRQYSAMAG
jgi:superfamily II DNA/RNA helicase